MSQYVTIIEAEIVRPEIAEELPDAEMLMNGGGDQRYFLGISSDPENLRRSIYQTYPFARFRVLHTIRAENRSELLHEALRMKLKQKHIVYSWYNFAPSDLAYLRNITDANLHLIIPQIENEAASADGVEVRDVTRRKGKKQTAERAVEPEIIVDEIEAMRQRLLEQIAEGVL